ncbi:MAG: hotdog domain-containing protein [Acidimicrobiia bacterium]
MAAALDECLGVAATASGASGMTVVLQVNLRGGTPFGRSVEIRTRVTGIEGRKTHVSGEVVVDGEVTADATALCIQARPVDPPAEDDA